MIMPSECSRQPAAPIARFAEMVRRSGRLTRTCESASVSRSSPRWMLAVVTLILMASMGGGFLLLPVLIPAHLWAARRSGSLGRAAWSLLPAASLAMVVWAAVYVSIGESKPAIRLLPLLVIVGAFGAIQYLLAKDQRRVA